jgi:hypothetical protein
MHVQATTDSVNRGSDGVSFQAAHRAQCTLSNQARPFFVHLDLNRIEEIAIPSNLREDGSRNPLLVNPVNKPLAYEETTAPREAQILPNPVRNPCTPRSRINRARLTGWTSEVSSCVRKEKIKAKIMRTDIYDSCGDAHGSTD